MTTLLSEIRPSILTAGILALDTGALQLTGPAGSIRLERGPFVLLRELMRRPWHVLTYEQLIAAMWPDPDLEPEDALHAVRHRAQRARDILHRVGASPLLLQTQHQVGYMIEGDPRVVRVFTLEQAAVVDQLAATHPAFQPARIAA